MNVKTLKNWHRQSIIELAKAYAAAEGDRSRAILTHLKAHAQGLNYLETQELDNEGKEPMMAKPAVL